MRYDIGDIVMYRPEVTLDPSLGFITEIRDETLIRVYWYIINFLPTTRATRNKEWIPASILEHAGGFRVISKKNGFILEI
tara:strand:- start:439 stop:678 length:240 start_codon:yes stop_codon:yes gene_type:complete